MNGRCKVRKSGKDEFRAECRADEVERESDERVEKWLVPDGYTREDGLEEVIRVAGHAVMILGDVFDEMRKAVLERWR